MYKKILMMSLVVIIGVCSNCGKKSISINSDEKIEKESISKEKDEKKTEKVENEVEKEIPKELAKTISFATMYKPIDYRDGYTIVQRSEEVELYGLLDEFGSVILEPEYDALEFVSTDEELLLKANYEGGIGIIDLKGNEKIKYRLYKDIVSAGSIGWLAKLDDESQVLLDVDGKEIKKLSEKYTGVIAGKYLYKSSKQEAFPSDIQLKPVVEYGFVDGMPEIYDLDENVLMKNSDKTKYLKLSYYYSGVDDIFLWLNSQDENGHMACYLVAGKINEEKLDYIGRGDDDVVKCFPEENTVLIGVSTVTDNMVIENKNCKRCELNLKQGVYNYNLINQKFEGRKDTVFFNQVGKYYTLSNNSRELKFDNKIQACINVKDLNYRILEDIDFQYAMIDDKGELLIPFGTDLKIVSSTEFSYKGKMATPMGCNTSMAIYINGNGQYEVYGFNDTNKSSFAQ